METSLSVNRKIVLWGALVTTILIIPNSYDPVSFPKSFILILFVSTALTAFIWKNGLSSLKPHDFLDYLLFAFFVIAFLNVLINHNALEERIFGVSGRAIGLLTLFACAILMLLVRRIDIQQRDLIKFLLIANLIVSLYFLSQKFGFEIGKYQEYYGAPSSTLGNPNFVSGFIGFSAISALVLLDSKKKRFPMQLLILLVLLLNIWVIKESISIQGVVALGVSFFVFVLATIYGRPSLLLPTFVIGLLLSSLSLLGFFGLGPASNFFSSTTVYSRLDYWRAAIAMTLNRPFTGHGLDAFGDNYRLFRDQAAFERFGESQVTDSAHNIYLDFFAAGGVLFGILFIGFNLIPLLIFIKSFKSKSRIKLVDRLMISLWFGFQIQALISPNQIGIFVWIWIILGVLSRNSRVVTPAEGLMKKKLISDPSRFSRISSAFVSAVVVTLAFLPLKNNVDFLTQGNKADGLALKSVALRFPQDSKMIALVAQGFQNANYPRESADILRVGLEHNPNSFTLWKLLYDNKEISSAERLMVRGQLNRLEPRVTWPVTKQ